LKPRKGSIVQLLGGIHAKKARFWVIEGMYSYKDKWVAEVLPLKPYPPQSLKENNGQPGTVWLPDPLGRTRVVRSMRLRRVQAKRVKPPADSGEAKRGWSIEVPLPFDRGTSPRNSSSRKRKGVPACGGVPDLKGGVPDGGSSSKKVKRLEGTGPSRGGKFKEVVPLRYVSEQRNMYRSKRQRERLVGSEVMVKLKNGWAFGRVSNAKKHGGIDKHPFSVTFDDKATLRLDLDPNKYSGSADVSDSEPKDTWCVVRLKGAAHHIKKSKNQNIHSKSPTKD